MVDLIQSTRAHENTAPAVNRVIYLHGFASGPSSNKARHFRQKLNAAGFEVTIPDLAAGNFEGLTLSGQLQVIADSAAGKPATLMGSSMGGYLAALYAARHAGITRVVLLAPAFRFAPRWRERMGAGEIEAWRRDGAIDVFHYGEGRTRALGYQLLEDAAQYEDFPNVKQPCLIFHGAHDDVVPAAYSEQFAAAHPNVKLHVLNSGHELTDVLDEMGARVEAFLKAT